jgi:hypothetical protein
MNAEITTNLPKKRQKAYIKNLQWQVLTFLLNTPKRRRKKKEKKETFKQCAMVKTSILLLLQSSK